MARIRKGRSSTMYNIKPKKCVVCKEAYQPFQTLQKVCGVKCAAELAKGKRENKERAITKEKKRLLKEMDRSHWLKKAQIVFNAWIRERDKGLPCISCGKHHSGQYHAGHYRTVASCSALRFCEMQVWKQCAPCNLYKSGDIINYRNNLIKKIGIENVEKIENYNESKRWTIEELKEICQKYRKPKA